MRLRIVINMLLLVLMVSCARAPVISFSSGSLPPEVKTVSIQNFFTDVPAGPANLGLTFTEKFREYYQRNSRLAVIKDNGDFAFEGSIMGYDVSPVAPTAGATGTNGETFQQIAGQQRLTVTVKVTFTNSKDSSKDFETTFSNFRDFPASQNISNVERELVDEIFNLIILDIFNRSAGDW